MQLNENKNEDLISASHCTEGKLQIPHFVILGNFMKDCNSNF